MGIFLPFSLLLVVSCGLRTPVKLGFTAELTGRQSEVGIQLRNGVQLAVEERNNRGGIRGRPIKLLEMDDRGNAEGAQEAERSLIDAGVAAILGHFCSDQTLAGYRVAMERGTVLISATASTSLLSGKKDLFFRTVAGTETQGALMARYIRENRKLESIALLVDKDNQSFSLSMADTFTKTFRSLGGKISSTIPFSNGATKDYKILAESLRNARSQGIFIIADSPTTGLISQHLRLLGWEGPLFSSSWALGKTLLQNGGKAVEGMDLIIGFDPNDDTPQMLEFKKRYTNHYGASPIFSAMEGYETMGLLLRALETTGGSAQGLGDALLSIGDFTGLTGPIRFDEYGDVIRPAYIQRVVGGSYVTILKIKGNTPK